MTTSHYFRRARGRVYAFRIMSTRIGLALSSFLLVAPCLSLNTAWAQEEPDIDAPLESSEEADDTGDEVDLVDEDTPPEDGDYDFDSTASDVSGGAENPNAPRSSFTEGDKEIAPETKIKKGYPSRAIDRPLNLPAGTSELTLSLPVSVDPVSAGATLEATYGILDNIQFGLGYNLGAVSSDGLNVGKVISLRERYLFMENVALELAIPISLDPFAVGLVFGAPMRFAFFDAFALVFGQDLLAVKVHEFSPSLSNAGQNAAYIEDLADGTLTPDWTINATLGVIYQLGETQSLDVQFGTNFDDSESAATTHLRAGLVHVHDNSIDLGARVGASDLSALSKTFSLELFIKLRI